MAQDTNSRANMTYEAYKQFTNPIDITPIQQQQQFEEGKRRVGIQQEQAKAKRKDELAQDFSLALKHGLVPAFAKGINDQFDELRQMYINGDVDIDTARAQLMGIEQQIAEFKPVSETLREAAKNPNDYLYYNEETDTYETGIDTFMRSVFTSNGFGTGDTYEQVSNGMNTYNNLITKPEDIQTQLASLGKSVWEANANQWVSEPKIEVDEQTGQIIIKSSDGKTLDSETVDRIVDNMAGSREFLEAAEIEYKLQGNEEVRERYDNEKEYLKDKIKGFIKTSEIDTDIQTRAPREEGGGYGDEESDFALVVTNPDNTSRNALYQNVESLESVTGDFLTKPLGEFLDAEKTKLIQVAQKGTGEELKEINIEGRKGQVDRIFYDGDEGFIVVRNSIDVTSSKGEGTRDKTSSASARKTGKDEIAKFETYKLTDAIKDKINTIYKVDVDESYKNSFPSAQTEEVVNPFEQ